MDSTPLPEVFGWFVNAVAVVAVFGALVALIAESRDHDKAHVTVAPILAAVGVIIFLAGNVLRYVLAAFG
jgi:H+/Cl- antiporter ClcA